MNPLERSELIQIPKSHLQSMNTRLLGIKNLIRINVDKEKEIKILKNRCQTMEAKYSGLLKDCISGNSNPEAPCSNLTLPDTSSNTKQVGISEETYYNILEQLFHARSVLKMLKKTTNKPLMIESWTQTNESPEPTDSELEKKCLQATIEKQKLELEALSQKNSDLTIKLKQISSEKKKAQENEKKSEAKLKREKELHEKTQTKLCEIKAKNIVPASNKSCYSKCALSVVSPPSQYELIVDCGEEDIQTSKRCERCNSFFSTNDELDYHLKICQEKGNKFK